MERVINSCYALPPYRRQYPERNPRIHPSAPLCARATYIVVDLEEPRSLRPTIGWPANGSAHPDLNERIEEEFSSGRAYYDLISTHTKYAPSQRQWLTPLDHDLDESELEMFTPRTLELARIDSLIYGVPRNLDVKLLYYRTDLMVGPPSSWEELRDQAARLKSDSLYGFVFPGKESGLFGYFFELDAIDGGRMFDTWSKNTQSPSLRFRAFLTEGSDSRVQLHRD
jgi:extracellular solute-binding protein